MSRDNRYQHILYAILFLFAAGFASSPAHAQVTSLTMTSDAGDYIGNGQTYFYAAGDGSFNAQVNYDGGISIGFNGPNYSHWWNLDFSAPGNQPLTAGTYLNATRFPFQAATEPGLSVYGDGRGCNTLTGTFNVLQVVYGPNNTVTSFDATFEQHCEGAAPALRGEIRYNANVPLYLTAPTTLRAIQNQSVSFTVQATDAQGLGVTLNATALPPGASFSDNHNNTGNFSWLPTSSQSGPYVATFTGSDSQGHQASVSTQITVIPPPPANDEITTAASISGIPYTMSEVATTATSSPTDPYCYGNAQSVWFTYTAQANGRLEANTFGSGYDTTLGVYAGSPGALVPLSCNEDAGGTVQSRVRFDVTAGTTYYFMVSSLYFPVATANLVFNVLQAPPPFSFSPTVNQFGTVVSSTGVVTISGSVRCSDSAYVYINGQAKQTRGGAAIAGYWSTFVPCSANTVTPWSATVQSQAAIFHGRGALLFAGGKANVGATAFSFDPDTGEYKQVNISTIVTLRGK
jgi:hypothetical protein